MPQIGETIYYRRNGDAYVRKAVYVGETSRSWLVGSEGAWWLPLCAKEDASQYAVKLPKKAVAFETQEAFELGEWASNNRYRIREQIQFASPEKLKQIAEIIGYKEEAS